MEHRDAERHDLLERERRDHAGPVRGGGLDRVRGLPGDGRPGQVPVGDVAVFELGDLGVVGEPGLFHALRQPDDERADHAIADLPGTTHPMGGTLDPQPTEPRFGGEHMAEGVGDHVGGGVDLEDLDVALHSGAAVGVDREERAAREAVGAARGEGAVRVGAIEAVEELGQAGGGDPVCLGGGDGGLEHLAGLVADLGEVEGEEGHQVEGHEPRRDPEESAHDGRRGQPVGRRGAAAELAGRDGGGLAGGDLGGAEQAGVARELAGIPVRDLEGGDQQLERGAAEGDLGGDVAGDVGAHASGSERPGDGSSARPAERHGQWREPERDPGLGQLLAIERGLVGRHRDHPPDQSIGAGELANEVRILEAGLEADDRGIAGRGHHVLDPRPRAQRRRRHTEHDQVPRAGPDLVHRGEQRQPVPPDRLVADLPAPVQRVEGDATPQAFDVLGFDEEAHLGPTAMQVPGEGQTDGAGTDDQDVHAALPAAARVA